MSNKINLEYALNTPCIILKHLPDEDKDYIADLVLKHYREIGFPYYTLPLEKLERVAKQMIAYNSASILLEGNELNQVMLGLNLANFYHPQMWTVQCNNSFSPMDIFSNDGYFKRAILKRIQYSDTKLLPYNIRKSLMVFGGAQRVSNFRPTVAKYIYDRYCPKSGTVLDPCAGYGGRLLGAWASDNPSLYVGIDPDIRQLYGNSQMARELSRVEKRLSSYMKAIPFEDYKIGANSYDLVFTSPPYFDTEIYSYEKTQSCMRYRTYDKWVERFLLPLITKSHAALKVGGYFVLNVGSPIVEDSVFIGNDMFGQPENILQMRLSRMIGSKNPNKFKYEPIYVWKKGE